MEASFSLLSQFCFVRCRELAVIENDHFDRFSDLLNSMFTKFLKRYLGVPYMANNSIFHFLSATEPLRHTLEKAQQKAFLKITLPDSLSGLSLEPPVVRAELNCYDPISTIPAYFWVGVSTLKMPLPVLADTRRALLYDVMDLIHPHICERNEFHLEVDETCVCRLCHQQAPSYHHRVCSELVHLSISARLRRAYRPTAVVGR